MKPVHAFMRLYFIAGTQDCLHLDGDPAQNLLNILQQALQSGITCYQFREKGKSPTRPRQNQSISHSMSRPLPSISGAICGQ